MALDKRPCKNSKDIKEKRLGERLVGYTNKSSSSYDAEFDKEIRRLKPDWFLDKVANNKKLILELDKKPSYSSKDPETRRLGMMLSAYIVKTRSYYDAEFDKEIRRLKPHWFLNTATINKEKIMKLDKKPSKCSKDPEERRLCNSLHSYTGKTQGSYDPEFDKEIRKLKPDWFKKK